VSLVVKWPGMAEGSLGIYRREAAAMYCLEESSHLHRLGLAKSVKLPISCISSSSTHADFDACVYVLHGGARRTCMGRRARGRVWRLARRRLSGGLI
jgi:hypothetical protein